MARKEKKKAAKAKGKDEPEPWINSEAKAVLRQGIVEGSIPNSMTAEDVYEMCDLFKLCEFTNFKTNLKSLRDAIAKDYDRMAADAEAFGHDVELKKILREKDPPPPLPYTR